MKKIISVIMAGVLAFSMVACGKTDDTVPVIKSATYTVQQSEAVDVAPHVTLPEFTVVDGAAGALVVTAEQDTYLWEVTSADETLATIEDKTEDPMIAVYHVTAKNQGTTTVVFKGVSLYGKIEYTITMNMAEDLTTVATVTTNFEEYDFGPAVLIGEANEAGEIVVKLDPNATWEFTTMDNAPLAEGSTKDVATVAMGADKETNTQVLKVVPAEAGSLYVELVGTFEMGAVYRYLLVEVAEADKALSVTEDFHVYQLAEEGLPLEGEFATITEELIATIPPIELMHSMIDVSDKEILNAYFGAETLEGILAASVSEPMMSSIAFQVSVLEFDTNENATTAVSALEANAPLNRWVCVSAEKAGAKVVNDHFVVFMMTDAEMVDNFKA